MRAPVGTNDPPPGLATGPVVVTLLFSTPIVCRDLVGSIARIAQEQQRRVTGHPEVLGAVVSEPLGEHVI